MTDPATPQPVPQRGRRDRGAVILLTAIALPVLLLMTSFAIDLGRQRALRRTMQAKADVIALDLSRLLDGSTPANAIAYSAPLAASAGRNDVALAKIQSVEWGTLDAVTKKFIACTSCVPEAVKVTTHDTQDNLFQTGQGSATRSAVAASSSIGGFSIGSFAAAVNPGSDPSGLASGLLNTLLGDALNLGVLGYSGLASANVTYLQIASELGLATPGELFTGDVSAYEALEAQAEILRRGSGNAAQLAVLDQILAVPNSPLHDVSVGEVANVQAGGENAALASTVNVLDFLTTSAFLANGSSGLSIPATTLGIAGLTGNIGLNLIQSPQTAFGPLGTQASTSQATLTASFPLDIGNVCAGTTELLTLLTSLLGTVSGLLGLLTGSICGLLRSTVNLTATATFSVDLAKAIGTIDRIACTASNEQLGIGVQSGLVSTSLNLNVTARVGSSNLAPFGLALNTTGNGAASRADFTLPPELFDVFKSTTPPSGNLGLVPTQLDTQGLGVLLTPIKNAVNPIATLLNDRLVLPLAKMLGVRVASADVAPRLVSCDTVKLVG